MVTRRRFLQLAAFAGTAGTGAAKQFCPPFQQCGAPVKKTEEGIYFDSEGLIAQRNCDGGDTAQREGWYWFGLWVRSYMGDPCKIERTLSFEEVMKKLEIGQTGTFRRNPRNPWNDPSDFTRDQTIPLVAAMGILNDSIRLQRFYHELRKRNWFAQKRGDEMTTPAYRNFIARARNEKPNSFTDAKSLYLAAGARNLGALGKFDNVGDDLNLLIVLLLATVRRSSSKGVDHAREYYAKNRPDNYGMFLGSYRASYGTDWEGKVSQADMFSKMDAGIKAGWQPDCPRILGALRWYFRVESGGSPGLAELYAPIVMRWFQ